MDSQPASEIEGSPALQPSKELNTVVVKLWELLRNFVTEFKALREKNEKLEISNDILKKELLLYNNKIEDIKAESRKQAQLLQSNENEIANLEARNAELESEKQNSSIELEKYRELFASHPESLSYKEKYEETQSANEQLSEQLSSFKQNSDVQKQTLSALQNQILELNIKIEKSEAEKLHIQKDTEKHHLLEAENQKLREDLAAVQKQIADIEFIQKDLIRKNVDIYNKTVEIEALKNKIAVSESKLAAAEQLEEQYSKISEENSNYKLTISDLIEKEKELSEKILLLEAKLINPAPEADNPAILTLEETIKSLNFEILEKSAAIDEYSEKQLNLEKELLECRQNLNNIQNQKDKLKPKIEKYISIIDEVLSR